MPSSVPLREGQTLTGPLFNEPMRVETVAPGGAGSWVVGLVGTQSERFRRVTLSEADLASLTILDSTSSFDGDGNLLRLGIQAYSLGVAHEFAPCTLLRPVDFQIRRNVARAYASWCFERRAQLPPEWTAIDTAATEKKALEFLQSRFEACYPFHPATLSVFQRKWRMLRSSYRETRGTLAMLAQWISWAFREAHIQARNEPLITLGSAPLDEPGFRVVVLGQLLGEGRLDAAIDTEHCR